MGDIESRTTGASELDGLRMGTERTIMLFTEDGGGNLGSRMITKIHERLLAEGMSIEEANRWAYVAGCAASVAVAESFDGQAAFRIDIHPPYDETGAKVDKNARGQTFSVRHTTLEAANAAMKGIE